MEMLENSSSYFDELFHDIDSIMPPHNHDIYSQENQQTLIQDLFKSYASQESTVLINTNPSSPSSTDVIASSNPTASHFISFGNGQENKILIKSENYNNNTCNSSIFPTTINFGDQHDHSTISIIDDASSSLIKKGLGISTRTPVQAFDHVMAERKRRQKLGQHFISLSKLVPGLKKLDKASLLEDAIEHLKSLQERVSALQQEELRICSSNDDDDESKDEDINIINGSSTRVSGLEIKARVMSNNILLKIFCKNEKGLMSRIPCEIEKMQLSVIDMRVMPFGDAALDITILVEMQSEFRGTVKDIVDQLEMIFLKPRDQFSLTMNMNVL